MTIKKIFCTVLMAWVSLCSYSQTRPAGIKDIIASIDTLSSKLSPEKLYLHFDKPYYSTGDTIWFKAYLFDATFLTASQKSGLVYLELANDTNKVLLRRMLSVTSGLGRGNIVLNKDDIPEGSYTIRAYTNLMRNLGEDHFFSKNFYVSGNTNESWLISSNAKISKESGKENLRLGLQFQTLDKKAVGLRELQVRVMEGKRVLLRDKVQTDVDGILDVNFNIPEKADTRDISIVAEDLAILTARKIAIPIPISRQENIDLQFMPEGGGLVNGVATKIGFKAIGEDGKGMEVTGKVYSRSNNSGSEEEVAGFSSLHKGMGSFELLPKSGRIYTARIILPDGTAKTYPLPPVKNSGTVLNIINPKESDSIEVRVSIFPTATATPAAATSSTSSPAYYLLGQSGDVVAYAAVVYSNVKTKIAKSRFKSGIVHFSLLGADRQALNERIVYVDNYDNLQISVNPDKSFYKTRDSIALNIEVRDKDGKPVQGSFSIAVTDDSQVKIDSASGIQTNLLLTSYLKGSVEAPGNYFKNTNESWEALDNLLLTQGWVGYDWQKTFDPKATVNYSAEQEFTLKGKVINVFNKTLEGVKVVMISTRPLFVKDTVADHEGRFTFENFPILDSAVFRIQATNKRDKSFNVGIETEEFKPPVFAKEGYRTIPWYMNSDTTLLNYVKNTIAQKQEEFNPAGKNNVLSAVTITGKKIIKGSWNLNGPGNADITLDENNTKRGGKLNLAQFLDQKIPGFFVRIISNVTQGWVNWHGVRGIRLIMDGMDITDFGFSNSEMLEYFTAEDIKGIEVMYPGKNTRAYEIKYNSLPCIDLECPLWIEVTTRSGNGPFNRATPGTYLFKAMPFAGTKQFYSPKYPLKNKPAIVTDLRSTIHWEPDVITDKNGKAVISFYSADRPGTYTVITEGSDMDGNVGSRSGSIKITK